MRCGLLGLIITLSLSASCGRTELVHYPFDPPIIEPVTGPRDAGQPPTCTATAVENYVIPPRDRRPIDVLFVIDDSCSMEDDQRELGANMGMFFDTFRAGQVDFHVGIVSTDMTTVGRQGQLVGPFLTDATPDVATVFRQRVIVGTLGSPDEQGLAAASAALTPPVSTTVNAGFLRPEADFALVFLTDEDDQSAQAVSFFANQVKGLKPDGAAITVGSILIGCSGTEQWRYAQYTRLFGARGIITNCTHSYATTLRTIAGRAVNERCIVGLREPLDENEEITVTLDGAPATLTHAPPEDTYPNGSVEVVPCPVNGGQLALTWSTCAP